MINLQQNCYLNNNFSSRILSKSIAFFQNMCYNISYIPRAPKKGVQKGQ